MLLGLLFRLCFTLNHHQKTELFDPGRSSRKPSSRKGSYPGSLRSMPHIELHWYEGCHKWRYPKWFVYTGKSHVGGWWLGVPLWLRKPPYREYTLVNSYKMSPYMVRTIPPSYCISWFINAWILQTSKDYCRIMPPKKNLVDAFCSNSWILSCLVSPIKTLVDNIEPLHFEKITRIASSNDSTIYFDEVPSDIQWDWRSSHDPATWLRILEGKNQPVKGTQKKNPLRIVGPKYTKKTADPIFLPYLSFWKHSCYTTICCNYTSHILFHPP